MYTTASAVTVESDEKGFELVFTIKDGTEILYEGTANTLRLNIQDCDLDAFYDQVKARIGPYLRERDEARRTAPMAYIDASGAYDLSDPKHPDHHSVHVDLWDSRDGK
jgi:hypothetical protein